MSRTGHDRTRPPQGPDERRNSLRMSPRELGALLDSFDAPDRGKSQAKREFIRWPFRRDALSVLICPPGAGAMRITMACRNISRTGISLLHSCYVHIGTRCTVMLPGPGGAEVPVKGWVARCNHRSGMVHEIGVSFVEPVEVRDLVRGDPFADCFSLERVKGEDLKGNVLYVDDSEMDVRIVRHFLRGTSLNVRTAGTVAEALAGLDAAPDLIITDFNLPDGKGLDVLSAVRQRGCRTPVIIVTSDREEATRKQILASPPDACLTKPLTQDLLHRAVAEFRIVKRHGTGAAAATTQDAEAAALVQSFVGGMKQTLAQFESAIGTNDHEHARLLCLQIAGSAPTLGFGELADQANQTAKMLARTQSVPDCVKLMRGLMAACERLKGRAAA